MVGSRSTQIEHRGARSVISLCPSMRSMLSSRRRKPRAQWSPTVLAIESGTATRGIFRIATVISGRSFGIRGCRSLRTRRTLSCRLALNPRTSRSLAEHLHPPLGGSRRGEPHALLEGERRACTTISRVSDCLLQLVSRTNALRIRRYRTALVLRPLVLRNRGIQEF